MTIDWNAFAVGPALAGGALIGAAAALLVLGAGRIAGISGIVGGLLVPRADDRGWRWAFVAGLASAPWLASALLDQPLPRSDAGVLPLLAAGLLVGFGTRLGSGCTSGHGVCGLSRLSLRSLVATLAFIAAGMAVVFVLRHGAGA